MIRARYRPSTGTRTPEQQLDHTGPSFCEVAPPRAADADEFVGYVNNFFFDGIMRFVIFLTASLFHSHSDVPGLVHLHYYCVFFYPGSYVIVVRLGPIPSFRALQSLLFPMINRQKTGSFPPKAFIFAYFTSIMLRRPGFSISSHHIILQKEHDNFVV